MKTIGAWKLFSLLAGLLLSCNVWAQVATIVYVEGAVQAIPASGSPRDLKKGDTLNQGDTIVTKEGAAAAIVFQDAHNVVLSGNSRFAITSYVYNKSEPSKSSILLNLLSGGMRAVTGLIGKAKPENVNYRAGNATIGIRGTVVNVTLNKEIATVVVERYPDGRKSSIVFSYGSRTVTIEADKGATVGPNGEIVVRSAAEILAALGTNAAGLVMKAILNTARKPEIERALTQAIKDAGGIDLQSKTTPTQGNQGSPGSPGSSGSSGSGSSGGGGSSR